VATGDALPFFVSQKESKGGLKGEYNILRPFTLSSFLGTIVAMPYIQTLVVALCCLVHPAFAAVENIRIDVQCHVTGMPVTGTGGTSTFTEVFSLERSETVRESRDGRQLPWVISKAKFTSDGIEYQLTTLMITKDYAALAYVTESGAGFNRRLLAFTFVLDLQAMQLTRNITSLPENQAERTHARCKAL
jgi:hypothetical protein